MGLDNRRSEYVGEGCVVRGGGKKGEKGIKRTIEKLRSSTNPKTAIVSPFYFSKLYLKFTNIFL